MDWWIYLLTVVIIGTFWYLSKGRKHQKPKKTKIDEEIREPGKIEIIKPLPQERNQISPSPEINWDRVFKLIGIICFLIIAIGFIWGVSNDKFSSFSSFTCPKHECPDIEIPSCPPCPTHNFSCICPNVSIDYFPPDINIYINQTNSSD